jgi:hypothetical protein
MNAKKWILILILMVVLFNIAKTLIRISERRFATSVKLSWSFSSPKEP